MDQATNKDPIELLIHAGSGADTWLLIGGPIIVVSIFAVVYAVIVWIRNKRETAELILEEERLNRELPTSPASTEAGAEGYEGYEEDEDGAAKWSELTVDESTPVTVTTEVEEIRTTDRASWLERLSRGLAKSRASWQQSLSLILTGKTRLDEQVLEDLHAALYRADVGVAAADSLVDHVRRTIGKDNAADPAAVANALKERAAQILSSAANTPLNKPEQGPWVVLIVGVNGVGKTTTIGKLTAHFLANEQKVLLAAADTFRAAAVEQLVVWGDRLGVDVIKHKQGADPAAVAYDGVKAAVAREADVLLIDTAGRLHAKQELMEELGKINRIIGRDLPGAPHETWLVIDATTGQNALMQVKAFSQVVKLTGLVVTKLDGTAKGGVLLSIAEQFKLPIRYVGVGEKAADLRAFDAGDFAGSLF
jgi:fused signal recognition particle receptor